MSRLIGSVLGLALLSSAAIAQDRYNLAVTPEQLNLIRKGLIKLPFEEVFPVLNDIAQQALAQEKAVADARLKGDNERLEKAIEDRLKQQESPPELSR